MKTTLEIPDPLFRRAKSAAAQRGVPFREFVSEAIRDKLNGGGERPWMRAFGKLRELHEESALIDRSIEEEFGRVEPEDRE
jgi:hypothetical protein